MLRTNRSERHASITALLRCAAKADRLRWAPQDLANKREEATRRLYEELENRRAEREAYISAARLGCLMRGGVRSQDAELRMHIATRGDSVCALWYAM